MNRIARNLSVAGGIGLALVIASITMNLRAEPQGGSRTPYNGRSR